MFIAKLRFFLKTVWYSDKPEDANSFNLDKNQTVFGKILHVVSLSLEIIFLFV